MSMSWTSDCVRHGGILADIEEEVVHVVESVIQHVDSACLLTRR